MVGALVLACDLSDGVKPAIEVKVKKDSRSLTNHPIPIEADEKAFWKGLGIGPNSLDCK
jgi:hypothetical protein